MKPQKLSEDCDVIIVNYNAGDLLIDCVLSAFAAGAVSVIVVDNDSTDGSLEQLEQTMVQPQGLIVIRNNQNRGFAAACNIGVSASTSRFLLFLNPDSVLEPDALSELSKVLDSSENIGMVGGLLRNLDGSEQVGARRVFPTPKRAFVRAFGLSKYSKIFPHMFSDFLLHTEPLPLEPILVEAISGACMLVKREAIDDVGLWDEGYFLHCEDLDWCMRFWQKGWKILFVPDAKITHIAGSCSRSRRVFVEWHKHKGMLRFYRKFFRQQYPGVLMGLVTLGVYLRFLAVAGYYTFQRLKNYKFIIL